MKKLSGEIIKTFIDDLKATKGTNNKKALVNKFIEDKQNASSLALFLSCVYSKTNLYQTEIKHDLAKPSIFEDSIPSIRSWYEAYEDFVSGVKRGSEGERNLSVAWNSCLSIFDKELLEYIVGGEIKCGIGPGTWNKIFDKELIYIPRYQRCSKLSDKNYENWSSIIVQTKEDAQFINIRVEDSGVKFYTRNWNLIETESLNSAAEVLHNNPNINNITIMGEIYVTDPDGNRYGREKSNGMISGIVATGEPVPEGCGFEVVLWDAVPNIDFDNKLCEVPYTSRILTTVSINSVLQHAEGFKSSVVKTESCDNMEEVSKIFFDIVNSKGEGVVIKNPHGVWAHHDGGHKDITKIKLPMVVKMRIKGFNEADKSSRHANTFASVNIESECGNIISAMSGMSDAVRNQMNNNRGSFIDKIVEVKCNGIQYNPEVPHSLYYANYLDMRSDVDKAQDLKDIEKVMKSAVEAIAMV